MVIITPTLLYLTLYLQFIFPSPPLFLEFAEEFNFVLHLYLIFYDDLNSDDDDYPLAI